MESFDQAWNLVLDICKSKMTDIAFTTWFTKIFPYEINLEQKSIGLNVPNNFYKKTIENCYMKILKGAFEQIFGLPFEVQISCGPVEAQTKSTIPSFYSTFSFENFVVGESNKFAHAAAVAVSNNPGESYNPLFIYGASGLGKTHLLCAIRNYLSKNNPEIVSVYIKGDDFTNELIDAIRSGSTVSFHMKYRKADLLLVDDIQFIAGKNSTQEEFFHTFNSLYEDRKQIVLTSDKPPKEIKTLEERLRTRFECGLIADIQIPDFETRTAIIKKKAEEFQVDISDEMCIMIASRLQSNVRQLEGAVKQIKARNILNNDIAIPGSTDDSIFKITDEVDSVCELAHKIIDEISKEYGISFSDIISNKRSCKISKARKKAIKKIRELTNLSLSEIGKIFGGRDHATIMYLSSSCE